MSGWTLAWCGWFAGFLLIEGWALFNRTEGDTLSEHVWRWWRVHDPRPTLAVKLARIPLALFLLWLLLHLTLGWFTPTHPYPGS